MQLFAFQKEYIRGISGWNFNLEDLKNAAALIDSSNGTCHLDVRDTKVKDDSQDAYNDPKHIYQERVNHVASERPEEDEIQEVEELNDALSSSFPSRPLEALKSCFDVCGADDPGTTASDSRLQPSVGSVPSPPFPKLEHCKSANCNGESLERSVSVPMNLGNSGYHKHSSGSLIPEQVLSPYMNADLERDEFRQKNPSIRNRSGPLLFRQMKDSRTHLSGKMTVTYTTPCCLICLCSFSHVFGCSNLACMIWKLTSSAGFNFRINCKHAYNLAFTC
jgi:serine/threonine-protein kinase OSR1/STK39